MLLYIHIPFCTSKCLYCSFYSLPITKNSSFADIQKRYVTQLKQHIKAWGQHLHAPHIETIFIGGGTPTSLSASNLADLLETAHQHFTVSPTAEISFEANPESLPNTEQLKHLLSTGYNRVSLGVQSFDTTLLRMLGRPHNKEQAHTAITSLHNAGFSNSSIDLIWGLPGQTLAMWHNDLEQALTHPLKHLSCYNLSIDENTPLFAQFQSNTLAPLPTEETLEAMYLATSEYLQEKGFLQYEISNFATQGNCCQHNMGYWQQKEYLGIGAGAVSSLNARRWKNSETLEEWLNTPVNCEQQEYEIVTAQEKAFEQIMLGLRTNQGIAVKQLEAYCTQYTSLDLKQFIQQLQQNSLITTTPNNSILLTTRGMLLCNSILERLL